MEEIVKVLMRRDGVSRVEAENILEECIEELRDAFQSGGSLMELEDIVAADLGLEPDYLEMLLLEGVLA